MLLDGENAETMDDDMTYIDTFANSTRKHDENEMQCSTANKT
jgi:hypothetical protein